MTIEQLLLAAQAIASGMMCGIIWFVQAVHYPLFAAIPGAAGGDYARLNRRRTAWVVLPPMLVEAAAAGWFVIQPPLGVPRGTAAIGLGLVAVLWLSTLAVQMPLHERLGRDGCRADTVARLVAGNWLRTVLWTCRAGLSVWMITAAG